MLADILVKPRNLLRKPEIPEIWKSNLKLKIHAKMTEESYLQISEYFYVSGLTARA